MPHWIVVLLEVTLVLPAILALVIWSFRDLIQAASDEEHPHDEP